MVVPDSGHPAESIFWGVPKWGQPSKCIFCPVPDSGHPAKCISPLFPKQGRFFKPMAPPCTECCFGAGCAQPPRLFRKMPCLRCQVSLFWIVKWYMNGRYFYNNSFRFAIYEKIFIHYQVKSGKNENKYSFFFFLQIMLVSQSVKKTGIMLFQWTWGFSPFSLYGGQNEYSVDPSRPPIQ